MYTFLVCAFSAAPGLAQDFIDWVSNVDAKWEDTQPFPWNPEETPNPTSDARHLSTLTRIAVTSDVAVCNSFEGQASKSTTNDLFLVVNGGSLGRSGAEGSNDHHRARPTSWSNTTTGR